eukprot:TRINITY_DN17381_c0_g1_i1.p1 TRINITY_DN17381_c0_g1~~TRINITY_DN17381_c0_g1_i1.p1  ORF type:complete len:528 (-),score=76.95 TRINITY_DN17381_c0_g1_i1:162-1745(-)
MMAAAALLGAVLLGIRSSSVEGILTGDAGWELLVKSVPDETPRTCYKTPGLPSWLQGTYLVGGPAKFELAEYKFHGIFDGFGMMNRFEFEDQQVCYTSVWLDTNYLRVSEEKQCPVGILFEPTTPTQPMICSLEGGAPGGDNNWVNTILVGGEALLLSDTSTMLRMDLQTLDQPGKKKWSNDQPNGQPDWIMGDHKATSGSAHPVQRPGTNTWISIVVEAGLPMMEHSYVAFYTYEGDINGAQPRKKLGMSAPLEYPPFLHSFGVTPNYVVLPVTLGLGKNPKCKDNTVLCGIRPIWQGIHVIDSSGSVTVFDTEPFAHVHIINSFENATGVTLDLGAYRNGTDPFSESPALDIAKFLSKKDRDTENPTRSVVTRLHLHLSGPLQGKATFSDFHQIAGSTSDFFRINQRQIGLPYCFYYGTQWFHDGNTYANMAVVKHDVCTDTKTYWSSPNVYVGEPFMIPSPSGAEDDGVVVFVALDGQHGHSMYVTLDAKTMRELNGTRVDLPSHIPFTAHGDFFPRTGSEIFA